MLYETLLFSVNYIQEGFILINKLIDFYKNELRLYSLVYQSNWRSRFFWWFEMIIIALSFVSIPYLFIGKDNIVLLIINLIVVPLISFLSHEFYAKPKLEEILNSLLEKPKYKEIIKKYELDYLKEKKSSGLYEIRFLKLVNYLEDRSLDSVESIKRLIELTEREASNRNFLSFYPSGLFLAFFIPIWTQYIKLIYNQIGSYEAEFFELLEVASLLTLTLGVYIAFIMFLLPAFKEIISLQTKKINDLKSFLEEIQLEVSKKD